MRISRRALITGVGATLFAPSIVRASGGDRRFAVLRDGSDIGTHLISVRRNGGEIQVAIDIELKVKILGITAYRYEMANREVWRDGRLISMDSKSNDDGERHFSQVKQAADLLEIDGSVFKGTVAGDSASTTYWAYDFMTRPIWISTADGDPLKVACSKAGSGSIETGAGEVTTEKWKVGGDMDIDLHYVNREWVSVRFDAGGEDAIYRPDDVSSPIASAWNV